jgi:hypothetical protein
MLPGINLPEQKWYESHDVYIDRIKKNVPKEDIVQGGKNYIKKQLDSAKEYTLEEAIKDETVRPYLVHEYKRRVKHNPNEPITDDYLRLLKYLFSGIKFPDINTLVYTTPFDANSSTKIHERAHAIDSNNAFIPSFGIPSGVKIELLPGIKGD